MRATVGDQYAHYLHVIDLTTGEPIRNVTWADDQLDECGVLVGSTIGTGRWSSRVLRGPIKLEFSGPHDAHLWWLYYGGGSR